MGGVAGCLVFVSKRGPDHSWALLHDETVDKLSWKAAMLHGSSASLYRRLKLPSRCISKGDSHTTSMEQMTNKQPEDPS